ncbi:phage tail sheath C-terminal domain-containing protein [Actinophytocola sp.]|uniref:phage tail sheath C-terminal domain-containing protein n=1 Tax=Actinophytocola sp. TaxID=1872138 RepID=UPI002ED07EA7
MPEYLSPGVYIEEVDAGPRPIAGVSTSTAGMVGVTQRGPTTGKPKLVTNFLEFQTTFGGFLPEPDTSVRDAWANDPAEGGRWWLFPLAVKGFFDNGGQRLYVKRVVGGDARPAAGALVGGLVSQIVRDVAAGATTLELSHLIGFKGNDPITIFRGDGVRLHDTTITGYDATTRRIQLDTALPEEVRTARGDYVQVGDRTGVTTVEFTAATPGAWAQAVQVQVTPMVAATLPVLPPEGADDLFVTRLAEDADANSTTIVVNPARGLDGLAAPFSILINNRRFNVTAVSETTEGRRELSLENPSPVAWSEGLTVRRVRSANTDDDAKLRIGGASRLYPKAITQLDANGSLTTLHVQSVTANEVIFDEPVPATVFENDRLYLIEARVDTRFADPGGEVTESFTNLRLTRDDPAGIAASLASRSQLVRANLVADITDLAQFPTPTSGSFLALADGSDGYESLSPQDFVGTDGGSGKRTGIVALEDIDEISICAVPGVWSGTVESALITHCELLKDRFAILDPQDGLDIEGIQTFREPFDTKYAALYYPWLVANDPSTSLDVEVPPSGHLAGIYARVDNERGVHKAPANVVIRGIRLVDGIAQDVTKRHQDLLNPKGINAIRFFPGLGQRVWGARTLSSDTSWKYINVRRLFLFLEESIDEGTQWVVFEPNDESLWALVRQTVSNFLTTVWRSGALAGTTADEAFFVTCDRSTMTEDDIANGRLICVIGVAPVFPAEFVIFRIQQKTREPQLA